MILLHLIFVQAMGLVAPSAALFLPIQILLVPLPASLKFSAVDRKLKASLA